MDTRPLTLFIIFGFFMMAVGQARVMLKYHDEMQKHMKEDPLISAIQEYHDKEKEEKGGLSGAASRGVHSFAQKVRPVDTARGDDPDSLGVAEDAFAEPQETPKPQYDSGPKKPGKLLRPEDFKKPEPTRAPAAAPSFYPPAAAPAPAQNSGQGGYYPPAAGR